MKLKFALCVLMCQYILTQEPPQQKNTLGSYVNSESLLKACTDPMCASTALIACCTYNVCNLPYPYACMLGGGISCAFLAWATETDSVKFPYPSINALETLKKGFGTIFPCMNTSALVTLNKQKKE